MCITYQRNKKKGGRAMVKRCMYPLMLAILVLGFLLLFLSNNNNRVHALTGPCSDCHTMHNSQNGTTVVTGGPYRALTKGDCVICHTGTNVSGTNIPYVHSTSEPTYNFGGNRNTLAGGNFYWVAETGGDAKGHNVAGIASADNILSTPPGYLAEYRSGMSWSSGQQVTCAGNFGCHGKFEPGNSHYNDPFAAISGAHHKNVNRTNGTGDASEVWNSYRFLLGIKGTEDPDWELTLGVNDHNGYYAVTTPPSPGSNTGSINYLCAECHGLFHSDTYSGSYSSPWLRHPTDYDMNNVKTKEYGNYPNTSIFNGKLGVSATGDYFADVPVGNNQGAVLSQVLVNTGDAIVLCVSCHRAHGSPYNDILRWDYAACNAGSQNANCGCFACHTSK